ncbi:hypothetical protein O6H91_03G088900 [Diphasiastrum complanatum]|uniref:Uncharacterized protein n=1 Tax=Diphasiastrum complanatum TaxID=34168 RepID=A0ACC2E8V3_DIPCM|nr:hypothetical protein O6H91_03G088900 [Diphasiastrum complanatum]
MWLSKGSSMVTINLFNVREALQGLIHLPWFYLPHKGLIVTTCDLSHKTRSKGVLIETMSPSTCGLRPINMPNTNQHARHTSASGILLICVAATWEWPCMRLCAHRV